MNFPTDRIIPQQEFAAALPPEWADDLFPQVRQRVLEDARKLVILDDDPTGGQTIHDLEVLTSWTLNLLCQALTSTAPAFFILTNSRSMSVEKAVAFEREIALQLAAASRQTGVDFDLLVRGDSTLRGHYPAELEAVRPILEDHLGHAFDGVILCPFFLEGGRVTAGDVHWVREGEEYIPAALSEFARDATFGYVHSNLHRWVEEKTGGKIPASAVASISLETIRTTGPDGVYRELMQIRHGSVAVVNAVTYGDMAVFVAGLLDAQRDGKRFLFRTSASFVKVRSGNPDRPLLSSEELRRPGDTGGLIVVGSYVQKSTRQLERVLELPDLAGAELDVPSVLDDARRSGEISRITRFADDILPTGTDAVIYTSRDLDTEKGKAGDLNIGRQVSSALVQVVRQIQTPPRFIIAKGGTTSSDLATRALGVRRARILGPILPGVPVWQLQEETRFPDVPYVVFPGNVGTDDSLIEAIRKLR